MADEAEATGSPADKEPLLSRVTSIAALIRDVGVILGIPVVLVVGLKFYDLQTKALEEQVKAAESQLKVMEAQNALLKETQYDRALSLLKSQKELFQNERRSLEKQIADLTEHGVETSGALAHLRSRLDHVTVILDAADAVVGSADAKQPLYLASKPIETQPIPGASNDCREGSPPTGAFSPKSGLPHPNE